jgi:hypothetical protein
MSSPIVVQARNLYKVYEIGTVKVDALRHIDLDNWMTYSHCSF